MTNQEIHTPRLLLRPLNLEDAADVFEWVSDPVVNRYMPYPLYRNVEQVRSWISQQIPEDNEFAFVLKESGKVIGSGSISPDENQKYQLGYNFNRVYWGKGYATEAAKAMIQWAHDELGARDFFAQHATANTASGNVLRKCGFQVIGYGEYGRIDGSEIFPATLLELHL